MVAANWIVIYLLAVDNRKNNFGYFYWDPPLSIAPVPRKREENHPREIWIPETSDPGSDEAPGVRQDPHSLPEKG